MFLLFTQLLTTPSRLLSPLLPLKGISFIASPSSACSSAPMFLFSSSFVTSRVLPRGHSPAALFLTLCPVYLLSCLPLASPTGERCTRLLSRSSSLSSPPCSGDCHPPNAMRLLRSCPRLGSGEPYTPACTSRLLSSSRLASGARA
ncbi:unnamed protein product [Closterium sp. NIES-64]|nr:unnamed protein product [Closterium sp. NIES-64]